MEVVILTKEFPPDTYGGAGVHVGNLSRALAGIDCGDLHLSVFYFGEQSGSSKHMSIQGLEHTADLPAQDPRHQKVLDSLYTNLLMTGSIAGGDLIHCHTWYTHFAGCLLKRMLEVPLILTTHSLEPHRPWKQEQLGTGYRVTRWLEGTAYREADGIVAVSGYMKKEVVRTYGVAPEKVRVIHNGIDVDLYRPTLNDHVLNAYGIDPDSPYILFVGRVTRQKGITYLADALSLLDPGIQTVLCAGAPDTEEIGREMERKITNARKATKNRIVWISKKVPVDDLVVLYSHASVFVCPSIYEPFGIINLEAMACKTPVVAAAVGGITEVVVHGETGMLVPLEMEPEGLGPKDPNGFSRDLASALNKVLRNPEWIYTMGEEARRRVERCFSWDRIARETFDFYRQLV